MKQLFLVILLQLIAPSLWADSVALKSETEMIASSPFIAIVEVNKAENGTFKGLMTYPRQKDPVMKRFSRRVSARVIERLKGKLPEEIQVYDRSGHWDSLFQNYMDQSKSDSGRFLVFLTGDVSFLTGSNGWASTFSIADGKIEWKENSNPPKFKMVDLGEISDRIRKQMIAK